MNSVLNSVLALISGVFLHPGRSSPKRLPILFSALGLQVFSILIGIPLYICATVSIPLAASLVAKGMSPGTAFVFLLADPTTNAATITMGAHFLEKRSAALIWERFLSVS